MKRLVRLSIVLVMVAAFVAGCTPTPSGTGTPSNSTAPVVSAGGAGEGISKVLKFAVSENMTTLDPHKESQMIGKIAHAMMFESLLYYDDSTGKFVPYLCESYDISEDGLTWTFKLRQGITFSNGEPLQTQTTVLPLGSV